GTIGFYIAPYTPTGEKIVPTILKKPDNSTLNIPKDYAFLAVNPEILGSLAPVQFPASDSAQFKNAFGPGDYELTVQTAAREVCYYVIPKTAVGRTLDVNLYFVGASINAAQAKTNTNVAAVMRIV